MADYIETSILLAVIDGNEAEALALIGSLLPGERCRLRQAVGTLEDLIDEVIDEKGENSPFASSMRQLIKGGDDDQKS